MTDSTFTSVAEFITWCRRAPDSVSVPAQDIVTILEPLVDLTPVDEPVHEPTPWRVRLWQVPEDVRLSVSEVCEALGRGKSWVYARAKDPSELQRLPTKRLAGELTFRVGDLRRWIVRHEEALDARRGAA